jgi:nucleoside-diphosphate-sugar epimerase
VVVDAASIVGGMNMIYGQGDPFRNLSRNVDMHAHVIDACLKCDKPPHLFTISSSAIYEQVESYMPHEIPTDQIPMPNHWYGRYKYLCEMYTQMSGLDHTILRLYNCAGTGDVEGKDAHVIPQLVRRFKSGDGTVLGTGTETRTFVHCMDVARIIVLLYKADRKANDIFNVARARNATSIGDLAMMIRDRVNPNLKLSFKESDNPSPIKYSLGNSGYLESHGIHTIVTLDEIIEEACNAYN